MHARRHTLIAMTGRGFAFSHHGRRAEGHRAKPRPSISCSENGPGAAARAAWPDASAPVPR